MESPVRPQGTKTSKRKRKGKSKGHEGGLALKVEIGTLKSNTPRKQSLMKDFKSMEEKKLTPKEKVIAVKEQEMEIKEMDTVTQILNTDTSLTTKVKQSIHAKLVEKIKIKYL